LLKNDVFEFSKYSGYILQVRCRKAKLPILNLWCVKNYIGSFLTALFNNGFMEHGVKQTVAFGSAAE